MTNKDDKDKKILSINRNKPQPEKPKEINIDNKDASRQGSDVAKEQASAAARPDISSIKPEVSAANPDISVTKLDATVKPTQPATHIPPVTPAAPAQDRSTPGFLTRGTFYGVHSLKIASSTPKPVVKDNTRTNDTRQRVPGARSASGPGSEISDNRTSQQPYQNRFARPTAGGSQSNAGAAARSPGIRNPADRSTNTTAQPGASSHPYRPQFRNNFGAATGQNVPLNQARNSYLPRSHQGQSRPPKRPLIQLTIDIPNEIVIEDFAHRMAIQAHKVLIKIREFTGRKFKVNATIDGETAALIAEAFGHIPNRLLSVKTELLRNTTGEYKLRPPIVTIAGHVDHGKTSTLDAIRNTKVAAGEFGGITQAIGAYQVECKKQKITFIDTPGHLAFTKMRARGILITDIAILIIAADSGIQEQTIESIRHIQNANTPMIVAINKMDAPGADATKIQRNLTQYGIFTEMMGGDIFAVEISAKTGQNINSLLEHILIQAELLELKAVHTGNAIGVVLEAEMVKGLGACVTIILNQGTLRAGDAVIIGNVAGKVRTIIDDTGKRLKEAHVSQPVRISGLDSLPRAGDELGVVADEATARNLLRERAEKIQTAPSGGVSLSGLLAVQIRTHLFIVKTNAHGMSESLKLSLEALSSSTAKVQVVYDGVGDVSVGDVELAQTTQSQILAFQVGVAPDAKQLMKSYNTKFSDHKIIYKVIEYVKEMIDDAIRQELLETPIGEAEVIKIFNVQNIGCVIGSHVTSGEVKIGDTVAFYRRGGEIYRGIIASIQHERKSVTLAEAGGEYGFIVKSAAGIVYKNALVKDKLKFFKTS